MRTLTLLALLALVAACGAEAEPGTPWRIELVDPAGRRVIPTDTLAVVQFAPGRHPRRLRVALDYGFDPEPPELPALTEGHYEVWVPGFRPARVDQEPVMPISLELGYPIDVEWKSDTPLAGTESVQVKARWRGAGDHPEAVFRTEFPAAAPAPGTRSAKWMGFVRGILVDGTQNTERLYVPWPGHYRITYGIGQISIQESPTFFSATGGGSSSPNDGIAIDVPETGPAPRALIPRR